MGRKNYSSDLTDKEWEEIKIYFPDTIRADKRGRPREHSKRELLNGIFYVVRSGCHLQKTKNYDYEEYLDYQNPISNSLLNQDELWKKIKGPGKSVDNIINH